MQNIIVIHGGQSFLDNETYLNYLQNLKIKSLDDFKSVDWKDNLSNDLGNGYNVISPNMPCKMNSKYNEWLIYFEKILTMINGELILIGHSLGALFLLKYISENGCPMQCKSIVLVACPFNSEINEYKLNGFDIKDFTKLNQVANQIHFVFSSDDQVVSIENMYKFKNKIPTANYTAVEGAGHFNGDRYEEICSLLSN